MSEQQKLALNEGRGLASVNMIIANLSMLKSFGFISQTEYDFTVKNMKTTRTRVLKSMRERMLAAGTWKAGTWKAGPNDFYLGA